MAQVGTGPGGMSQGVGSGSLGLGAADFYPSWGPSRREAAWLALDVALLFTPVAAFSAINRARLLSKLIKAERAADKTTDVYRIGAASRDFLLSRPVRTGLMIGLATPGAVMTSSGMWVFPAMMSTGRDTAIAYYRDREGRIRVISPNMSHQQFESRGVQGEVLPAARRTESFFDKDGIQRLSSFKRPRTPIPKWSFTTRSGEGLDRGNPLGEAPRTRARSAPTRRGNKITPMCPVHKRRHWCNVTRAMF